MNNRKVVVHLHGGIGNQLFQYSFGEYLRFRYGANVLYDISTFSILGPDRELQLNLIKKVIPVYETNKYFFSRHVRFMRRGMRFLFSIKPGNKYFEDKFIPEVLSSKNWDLIYFDGYWQDRKYPEWIIENIGDIYRPLENFPEGLNEHLNFISHKNVTSIHIRRGDYLKSANINTLGICSLNYYNKAAELILNKEPETEFLVFTDDIDWVKANLKLPKKYTIVNDLNIKSIWMIYLMSKCKNNVMSNSTFSWWGNFLNHNKDKITVAPLHWVRKGKNPAVYSNYWHLIDNWI